MEHLSDRAPPQTMQREASQGGAQPLNCGGRGNIRKRAEREGRSGREERKEGRKGEGREEVKGGRKGVRGGREGEERKEEGRLVKTDRDKKEFPS